MRELNWWGWGYADARPAAAELAPAVVEMLGFGSAEVEEPARLEAIELPAPRIDTPFVSSKSDRIRHAYGRSFPDTVRAFRGQFDHLPDAVAYPRSEADVERVLEWASGANAAIIPYGGGTSVCGGVEPAVPDRYDGAVSLDLSGLDRVLEIDEISRAARIQAGASGPELESQLAERDLTMRFFPQSFELLDARRLDRHPCRRPLRDGMDARRRPGRVDSRDHTNRRLAVAPTSCQRGGTVSGPDADR